MSDAVRRVFDEVRTTDPGAEADLPAWSRMTGHRFEGLAAPVGASRCVLIRKGKK